MSRFNRDFELTVGPVTVRPPIRIVFNAVKSHSGGVNKLTLQVYNLKESNRQAIVKDVESSGVIPVLLRVGYQGSLQSVFQGNILQGSNDRRGTDFISHIQCLDGGHDYLNSFTSETVRGKENAIDAILRDMPNTTKGKITFQQELTRAKVLVGNSYRLIQESLSPGETAYIENEQLYIIKDDEVVSSFIPVVNADTGLLNTPQKENQRVSFETLMNPSIIIGNRVDLRSKTAPYLSGIYKVSDITYSGDSRGQQWQQSVTCFARENYTVL